MTTEAILLLI